MVEIKFNIYSNNGSHLVAYSYRGDRVRKTFKTKAAAKEYIQSVKDEIEKDQARAKLNLSLNAAKPVDGELPQILISDAIKQHLDNEEKRATDKENFKKERYNYRYLYEALFEAKIDYVHQINLQVCEGLQNDWLDEDLSWSTINRRMATLKSFLNKCVDWGYVAENKASKLKPLQGEYAKKPHWTQGEITQLLEFLKEEEKDLFKVLESLGARPKELCKATWDDVDLENGFIKLSTTKGKGSKIRTRDVPLSVGLIAHFKGIKKRQVSQGKFKPGGFIFLNPSGNRATPDWFGKRIKRARKKLGLRDGLVPYALRGMLVTFMAREKVPRTLAQSITGHVKAETMDKFYTQHELEEVRNVIDFTERKRAELFESSKRSKNG